MLLPIKFIAANIFVSGMIAGAVCGAVAVSTLSNPGRLNRLKDYLEESCEGRKNSLYKVKVWFRTVNHFGLDQVKNWKFHV